MQDIPDQRLQARKRITVSCQTMRASVQEPKKIGTLVEISSRRPAPGHVITLKSFVPSATLEGIQSQMIAKLGEFVRNIPMPMGFKPGH